MEEDGAVASAGISGQDGGILDESATVDSPEPLEVLNQVPSEISDTGKRTEKGSTTTPTWILGSL